MASELNENSVFVDLADENSRTRKFSISTHKDLTNLKSVLPKPGTYISLDILPKDIAENLKSFDTNGDGIIDLSEVSHVQDLFNTEKIKVFHYNTFRK